MSIDIDKLKTIHWKKLVSRPHALLFSSISAEAFMNFRQVTGIDWRVKNRMMISDGQLFHIEKDLDNLKNIMLKGGISLLDSFLRQLIWHVSAYEKRAKSYARRDFGKISSEQLAITLNNFSFFAMNAHNFMTPLPIAEEALTSIFKHTLRSGSADDKEAWWRALVYSSKENVQLSERRSFYRLARAYKRKSKHYTQLLEEHLDNYAWIGSRGYLWDRAWTSNTVEKRLLGYFVEDGSPDLKLKQLEAAKERALAARRKIMRKLKINQSKKLSEIVKLAQAYAYRRTWRTDIIYRAGYQARGLFYEIAKRSKLPSWSVPYLTISELRQMAKTGKPPIARSEISRRQRWFAQVMLNEKVTVISGLLAKQKLKSIVEDKKEYYERKIITGMPTCPGVVTGRVILVKDLKDISRVKRGDIIVATMTFPHFISGMERAAAFITDEGGVLSHAAIISREMGKPCVTGTRIATKTLSNGDIVELDANKGVVKIIKRK